MTFRDKLYVFSKHILTSMRDCARTLMFARVKTYQYYTAVLKISGKVKYHLMFSYKIR